MNLEEELKVKIREYRDNDGKQKITQSTVELYASRVRLIYEQYGGNKTLLEYFNLYSRAVKNIQEKYPNIKTLKTTLWAVIVVLNAIGAKEFTINKYRSKFKSIVDKINDEGQDDVKNEKEKENWITRKEIYDKICQVKELSHKTTGSELFDVYQQYMILNLYTLIPPLRNDFVHALVYEQPIDDMDKAKNYIFLSENKLILNKYKTKNTYGTKIITLPKELTDIITKWMQIRENIYPELKDRRELLYNTQKRTPMERRNVSKYLNKIFGKKVSTSMLRKVYLSEVYQDSVSGSVMKRDAELMCHSIQTQQTIYRKK